MKSEGLGDLASEFSDTRPEASRAIGQCERLRGSEHRLANRCSHKKNSVVVSRIQTSREFRLPESSSLFSLMMTDVGNEMPRHGKATKCLLNHPWTQP